VGAAERPERVNPPRVGIIGGSGLYRLLDDAEMVAVHTPYGDPTAAIAVGTVAGVAVAFVPRHGLEHEFLPHTINYRANLWALRELGVTWVIAPCASGSLQPTVHVGDFVVCDQYVDRTSGRRDTYFDGPEPVHVSAADPYSPILRAALVSGCRELQIPVHDRGTVVVIQGPRFSTRAESRWYTTMGWDVINMTAYPEAHLARELCLSYANVCLVTDYDVGLEGQSDVPAVSAQEVAAVFATNNQRVRALIEVVVPRLPSDPDPHCLAALDGARL
jgi:5'-methylthioadenosine phosphorylase